MEKKKEKKKKAEKHKLRRRRILFVFLLTGLGLLNYPLAAQYLDQREKLLQTEEYEQQIQNMNGIQLEEFRCAAEEYNRILEESTQGVTDAFSEGSLLSDGLDEVYEQLLNPGGNGVMCYIVIPKIAVSLPVRHGTSAKTLEQGAGHLYGTSLPVGGKGTHAVVSAHRGLPSSALFQDLDQLEPGDLFYIYVLNESMTYRVDSIRTVEPENTESLVIRPGEDLISLVTCTPYGINSHRLLIEGSRIDAQEADTSQTGVGTEAGITGISGWMKLIFLISVMLLIVYGIICLLPSGRKLKEE